MVKYRRGGKGDDDFASTYWYHLLLYKIAKASRHVHAYQRSLAATKRQLLHLSLGFSRH